MFRKEQLSRRRIKALRAEQTRVQISSLHVISRCQQSPTNRLRQDFDVVSGKSLLWVAVLGFVVFYLYALISFALLRSSFDPESDLYCATLWQCTITVIRYGLIGDIFDVCTLTKQMILRRILHISFQFKRCFTIFRICLKFIVNYIVYVLLDFTEFEYFFISFYYFQNHVGFHFCL